MPGANGAPGIDSRGWTGPEAAPPVTARARRALIRAAGGPGTDAPRRAASAVSWVGLPVLLGLVLVAADGRARWLGLAGPAARLRAWLDAQLLPVLGPEGADTMLVLLGHGRPVAIVLALAGALAGGAAAWGNRAALARGLAAAEARWPGGDRARGAFMASLLVFLAAGRDPGNALLHVLAAPALWFAARWMAAAMTEAAERVVAGAAPGRNWFAAELAVAAGALVLMLGHAVDVGG